MWWRMGVFVLLRVGVGTVGTVLGTVGFCVGTVGTVVGTVGFCVGTVGTVKQI